MTKARKNKSKIKTVAFYVGAYLFCIDCFNEKGFSEYSSYLTNKDIADYFGELFCDRCGKQL